MQRFRREARLRRTVNELPVPLDVLTTALPAAVRCVERTGRGGNSRVFRVGCADGSEFAAKFYFRRADSGRSRLDAEFNALSFMWRHGIRCIPRPFAANSEFDFALYEFVAGRPIDSAYVAAADIDQLVEFAAALKNLNSLPASRALPAAADACLGIDEIFRQIETRLQRLDGQHGDAPADRALARFLADEFVPAFRRAGQRMKSESGGNASGQVLAAADQTLSPSDFGFHNALRRDAGPITFLDFEYFGRDDPAKMIADFLLHPAQALNDGAKRHFVQRILQIFRDDRGLLARLEYLYPLVGMKWCMIMLNEFVPGELARREFAARAPIDAAEKKSDQLAKARAMLAKIMTENARFPYCGCAA